MWYTNRLKPDRGTEDILIQFSTLYPYLRLIAKENNIRDPFNPEVVEAYWIGNRLLSAIPLSRFAEHLSENLRLKKKLTYKDLNRLYSKLPLGAVPHHAFHVMNVYKRTGNVDLPQTVETMDACIINWGTVKEKSAITIIVETKPIRLVGSQLKFSQPIRRTLIPQGDSDRVFNTIKVGDRISYHWGMVCTKLNQKEINNLTYYTNLSMKLANLISS
jgi:hypothetical protein